MASVYGQICTMPEVKVGSINTTSFARKDRQVEIVRHLEMNKYDMCLLQETKLKYNINLNSKKYKYFKNDAGHGTMIIIRDRIKCEEVKVNLEEIECTAIKILGRYGTAYYVFSIYIKINTQLDKIYSDLNKIKAITAGAPFMLGGDLNTGNITQKNMIMKWLDDNNAEVCLVRPKTATFRTGSKLDYFVFSTEFNVDSSCDVENIGLEHNLINTTYNLNFNPVRAQGDKSLKWRKTNWEDFSRKAEDNFQAVPPFDRNLTNIEIDFYIEELTKDITNTIKEVVPQGLTGRKSFLEYSNEIDHFYKERRRLKASISKIKGKWAKDMDRFEHLKRSIAEASRKIDEIIKSTANEAIDERLRNINGRVNSFREINALMGKGKGRVEFRLKKDGNELTELKDRLEELKRFYGELYKGVIPVCKEMSEVVEAVKDAEQAEKICNFSVNNSGSAPRVNKEKFISILEVSKLIKKIPNKISSGTDGIPNIVIKKLPLNYIIALTTIFNNCINNGYFPLKWKEAIIVTIPKKQGIIEAKDLRPISLTPNLGKLLECAILRNLNNEIKEDTIPKFQYGFKGQHSAVDALGVVNNRWIDARQRRCFTAIASLDIKKAFDSVWHDGLIYKIDKAGAEPSTSRIIKSFLDDRRAKIKIGNTLSNDFSVQRGVPQGSRLGPQLYNMYIGDMKINLEAGGYITQYADDTLVEHSSMSAQHATNKVNKYCADIKDYLRNWGIELNEEKTDFMISRPPKKSMKNKLKISLNIGKAKITPQKNLKYLGITFQNNGSFKKHINTIAKRGRAVTGRARRLLASPVLLKKVKDRIYNTLILSVVTFAAIIWREDDIEPLHKMERWAFRYALNMIKRENGKFYPNAALYDAIEMDKLDVKIDRIILREEMRRKVHPNEEVRKLCKILD